MEKFPELPRCYHGQIKDFFPVNGESIWIWSIQTYSDGRITVKTGEGKIIEIQKAKKD